MNMLTTGAALVLILAVAGCGSRAESKAAPAGAAAVVAKEGELLVVELTPTAEQRLGITTRAAEQRQITRTRTLPGDVRVAPGRSVVLTAPLPGIIGGTPPAVGRQLEAEQTIVTLTPFLSADSRATFAAMQVDVEGVLAGARVQLEAGEIALTRATRMLRDGVGSQRAVDDAQAQRDSAKAAVEAATQRRDMLQQAVDGTLGRLPIPAPFAGQLRQLLVAPGQAVGLGAPLAEVADVRDLWVRVQVYVGDLDRLDTSQPVQVEGLTAQPLPVAPPTGDALTMTGDLFYAVVDTLGVLRIGQRVFVAVPLLEQRESLVVPWSAVHQDSLGGTWVYEPLGQHRYVRRRVQVRFVHDGVAAIGNGLRAGTPVVVTGVPELFGIEFGHAR